MFFYLTVFALLLTVVLSVLFIITGMFGELEQNGVAFIISMQVFNNIYYNEMKWQLIDKF